MLARLVAIAALIGAETSAEESFEDRVIEAILANPEVVLAALELIEQERSEHARKEAADTIKKYHAQLFGSDQEAVIAEFFDYRCGYCAQSANDFRALSERQQQAISLLEFPILGEASTEISKVSIAVRNVAGDEAYRAFHYAVFESAGRVNGKQAALQLAGTLGHDIALIAAEAEGEAVAAELLRNRRMAEALGVNGTPTFVSRKMVYPGLLGRDDIVKIIEDHEGEHE